MNTNDRKKFGLIGVVWGNDFGVVDLAHEKLVMYGFHKHRPTLYWYIQTVELKDSDFAVLLTVKDRESIKSGVWKYDDIVNEHANWGGVVALLLHPDYPFAPEMEQ